MTATSPSRIAEQEAGLVFAEFNEAVAFELGTSIRDRALRDGLSLVVEVRTWDRVLFYCALPGTTRDNMDWVRRKTWIVQRFGKSSYRAMLENHRERLYGPERAFDPHDYVLAGGSVPVRVRGAGIIGAVTVSGLPEWDDHNVVVDAIARHLGLDPVEYLVTTE